MLLQVLLTWVFNLEIWRYINNTIIIIITRCPWERVCRAVWVSLHSGQGSSTGRSSTCVQCREFPSPPAASELQHTNSDDWTCVIAYTRVCTFTDWQNSGTFQEYFCWDIYVFPGVKIYFPGGCSHKLSFEWGIINQILTFNK